MQAVLIAQNYCQNSDKVISLCFTNVIAFLLAVTVNSVGRVCTSRAFALPICRGTLELVFAKGALHTSAIRQLHLTRRNRDSGAGGMSVVTGRNTWSGT